jgi:hypothetical protein
MNISSEEIERIARNKKESLSGFSKGGQKNLSEYEKLGIVRVSENSDGALRVSIPNDKVNEFAARWGKLSEPGYWCEYIGPQTGFLFKSPEGKFRHIILTPDTEEQISIEMQKFTNHYNPDIWQWIYSCDIFTDWIES